MTIILAITTGVLFGLVLIGEIRIMAMRKYLKGIKKDMLRMFSDLAKISIDFMGKKMELELKLEKAYEEIEELKKNKRNNANSDKSVDKNAKRKKK